MNSQLELKDVGVAYGKKTVVEGMSFRLERGSIGCLLGPSGCGKTTVLRAIAGLEAVTGGKIVINGQLVSSTSEMVAPEKRRVGMVFQDYALFPHLSAADNVAFGLRGYSRAGKQETVAEVLKGVGLEGLEMSYPHELSGGQQQRLALARALAPKPDLLLMDEPFSNLDVMLREKISRQVREIIKEYGATALIVTHNHFEAFAIADTIGIINEGRLEQWDSAQNIYHLPRTPFVADFVGEGALIRGRVMAEGTVRTALGMLEGKFTSPCAGGCEVEVLVRPDDVLHDDQSLVKALVVSKSFRGDSILYSLKLESGEKILSLAPSHHDHPVGHAIGIRTEINDIVLFSRDPKLCGDVICMVA